MTNQQKLGVVSNFIRSKCPELNCKYCDGRGWTDYEAFGKLDCACCEGLGQELGLNLERCILAFSRLGIAWTMRLSGKKEKAVIDVLDVKTGRKSCYWELGLPLHHQKPEVWEFLFYIFKLNEDE